MAQTAIPVADRAHKAAKRYIYSWGDGAAEGSGTMKDLLGGKGAGLAEMTRAGLPTPPGFTITTAACNDYFAAGHGRRRRDRIRPLDDPRPGRRLGEDADRHVLAGFERRRLAVEADPERREGFRRVLAPNE